MHKDAEQVRDKYLAKGCELIGYEIRNKKQDEKRSRWDSSKHLLIYFKNEGGELVRIIASHQNNQSIKIHSYNSWFKDGFDYLKEMELKIKDPCFHCSKNIGVYEKLN